MLYKKQAHTLNAYVILVFILSPFTLFAQEGHRIFAFENNASYQTDVTVNSSSNIQRGKQILKLKSTTNISKIAKVTAANNKGFTFNINIISVDNTIEGMGKKLQYKSNNSVDGSTIKTALAYMINKPVTVSLNKYGIIESFSNEQLELATDTLLAFAGIQPEIFQKGKLFSLIADLTYTKNLLKGYNWTETATNSKEKTTTKFWIESINENNTILKFTSSSIGKLINTNSNGTYLIDNKSGIILEKLIYMVAIGYQVSADKMVYAVSRSSNIIEKTKIIR